VNHTVKGSHYILHSVCMERARCELYS